MKTPVTKIAYIGCDYWLDGKSLVHCVDVDLINLEAKVGVPDKNGMIWMASWIPFSRLNAALSSFASEKTTSNANSQGADECQEKQC